MLRITHMIQWNVLITIDEEAILRAEREGGDGAAGPPRRSLALKRLQGSEMGTRIAIG